MILKLCAFLLVLIAKSDAQYHQKNYHIVHEQITIVDYNHTVCSDPMIAIFKYNDTVKMKAINASANLPGAKKNIVVNAALYKLIAKEYRPFPINITVDACEEVEKNLFGAQSALAHSNFKKCPCPKGFYYLENFVLEEELFPPHLPVGQYKLDVHVWLDKTYLGNGYWLGSIIARKKGE